ncbi:rho GTPase-activating protein 6-like [Acipenser oxyrinchus oxyrinchus]|uniref:Rho GTPase-activating protein 6-like n=1 Tax=Acipenser oxyrinchus oxyrinchus TaxID=40147 RepID=A0AAD8FZP6_ACIOX|nr:rho GTPase-activating protein 6-like [Acipenser oxyrinchus oxyrinchus]
MQAEASVFVDNQFYYVGEQTWSTMLGQSVKLLPAPIQSLSELERANLQEVAFFHLQQNNKLNCQITIPKGGPKRRKPLRRKLDSFSKERKDKESTPKAFGIPLSEVISNDRHQKQKQDAVKESRRDCLKLEASVMRFRAQKQNKLYNSNFYLASSFDFQNEPLSPTLMDNAARVQRRVITLSANLNVLFSGFETLHSYPGNFLAHGGMSVDSITDLDDSQSRLLEALQLSHPHELENKRDKGRVTKLSLNPIYRQVPRIMDSCCQHIETYGLQTVGIFRVGSSKKRVRQLREEFDQGNDVILDDDQSVHDVAALLKEFLREMPDPLLPRELYTAFLSASAMDTEEQHSFLQLLIYLLPPCNCDTLHRLLQFLSKVASYAQNYTGPDGQEIAGNKMTAANLATIFGPNLLQREKAPEKDYSLKSLEVEDSPSIITVVQRLIENYESLFTVSPELQQEVLMSLLQSQPDVIDYLLRRKLRKLSTVSEMSNATSSTDGRYFSESSYDSSRLSSGDLSSLDSSPLFSEQQPVENLEEGSLSAEIFFSLLRPLDLLNQQRKRSSEDTHGRLRQNITSKSHHNLTSMGLSSFTNTAEEKVPCKFAAGPAFLPLVKHEGYPSPSQKDQIQLMDNKSEHFSQDDATELDLHQILSFSPSSSTTVGGEIQATFYSSNANPSTQTNQQREAEDRIWVKKDLGTTATEQPSPNLSDSERETIV